MSIATKSNTEYLKSSARSRAASPALADQMAAASDLARQSAAILKSLADRCRQDDAVRTLPPYPLSDLIDALNELSDAYDDFGQIYGFKNDSRIIDYLNDHGRRAAEFARRERPDRI